MSRSIAREGLEEGIEAILRDSDDEIEYNDTTLPFLYCSVSYHLILV